MADGLQVVQRAEAVAFSLRAMRVGAGFEYEILEVSDDVSMPEIAEVLFSAALDIHSKQERAER